jgi:cyanophycinase
MRGTIALAGGGPFAANDDLDRRLLAAVGADRVVVLPTADAFEEPAVLVAAAMNWAERLGVSVEALMVLQRHDAEDEGAADVVRGARAVWLVGDSSMHLRSVLKETPVLAALGDVLAAEGVVAAVGNSAAALCDPMLDQRGGAFTLGLGLVRGVAVIPGVEEESEERRHRTLTLADTPVVELPTGSALLRRADGWELVGEPVVHGELP